MSEFYNVLRKLRESKKLLQKEIAKELGISAAAYSLYEKGQREPKLDLLEKMAAYFGVTIDYLLTGKSSNIIPNRTNANYSELPGSISLDITQENYKKYTKYFNFAFSVMREIVCNEINTKMISVETGKKLEQKDIEETFDTLTIEKKLSLFREFAGHFSINLIFDAINIDLQKDEPPKE